MFLSEPKPMWHKSACHKSLPFFCGFQINYHNLQISAQERFCRGGRGDTRVREAVPQASAVQLCQLGKQVNHLFTTTVSRWSRVKNLPRDGTRTVRSGWLEFEKAVTVTDRGGRGVLLAHRIVFTMKRTMTARPTQPHITPITIAVTSPAQKNTQRVGTEKKSSQDSLLKISVMFCSINWTVCLFCCNVHSLVWCHSCSAQSHQMRAPSLSLQQNNKYIDFNKYSPI